MSQRFSLRDCRHSCYKPHDASVNRRFVPVIIDYMSNAILIGSDWFPTRCFVHKCIIVCRIEEETITNLMDLIQHFRDCIVVGKY